ncbi:prospero homeobox protein 2 [Alligator mississippiensis]|uniref:prospero homeobox protein 2 n=1 Tax=Alligator mississippiensis TaxID=8496 RepID=UPI002877CF17|nr:prospero homeobox protein 2 [Alligator mississippiensis]
MSLPHLKLEVPHTRRDLPWPWVASRTGEPCMGHSLPSAKQPRSLDPEGPEARARLQQELEAMAEQVGQLRENLAQISWGLAWAGLASGIPPRLERGVPPGLAQLLKEELGAVVDAVLRGVVPPPRCRPPGDQAEALALVVRKPPVAPLLPHSSLDGPPCQPPAQGSLTPGHLKKAKLMFFYTRYPSAATLKAYFPDVRFSRSVTAQLIKWFSNFREFFYLQAERFSRQALSGGRAGPQGPSVTPACQLARVLCQHFNKASDYQVPTGFLEVTQVAVREFSQAIAGGRDADPAWKKPIYRVISKLEADIPEAFRAPPGPPHT